MRALVCREPGELKIENRAEPALDPLQALVAVRRVGICGTDYHIFEGKHPYLQYPRVMGHELAVEVLQAPVGSGLELGTVYVVNPYLSCGHCIACRSGKPNCCVNIQVLGVHRDGGMAERLVLPPQNLVRADGLNVDECAAVEFLAIGAHAVRRGAVSARDRVLVVGAGPIGLGAALFARAQGARVAVYDSDPARAETAGAMAAVEIIDGVDVAASVAQQTGGEGFDVVLDATGKRAAIERGFSFVAHGGRYVLISVVTDPITFSDPDFHRKEMTLLGSRNSTAEDFQHVIAAIRGRAIDVARLVTHRTDLAHAGEQIPRWAETKTGLIKAVIEIG